MGWGGAGALVWPAWLPKHAFTNIVPTTSLQTGWGFPSYSPSLISSFLPSVLPSFAPPSLFFNMKGIQRQASGNGNTSAACRFRTHLVNASPILMANGQLTGAGAAATGANCPARHPPRRGGGAFGRALQPGIKSSTCTTALEPALRTHTTINRGGGRP